MYTWPEDSPTLIPKDKILVLYQKNYLLLDPPESKKWKSIPKNKIRICDNNQYLVLGPPEFNENWLILPSNLRHFSETIIPNGPILGETFAVKLEIEMGNSIHLFTGSMIRQEGPPAQIYGRFFILVIRINSNGEISHFGVSIEDLMRNISYFEDGGGYEILLFDIEFFISLFKTKQNTNSAFIRITDKELIRKICSLCNTEFDTEMATEIITKMASSFSLVRDMTSNITMEEIEFLEDLF